MPHFWVEMTVSYSGFIEADDRADAEQKAMVSYGDHEEIDYAGVEEVNVTQADDAWCEEHEEYECAFCESDKEDEDDIL